MLVGPLLFHASLMVPSGFTALYEAIAGIATVPTAILTARIKTAKRFFIAKLNQITLAREAFLVSFIRRCIGGLFLLR